MSEGDTQQRIDEVKPMPVDTLVRFAMKVQRARDADDHGKECQLRDEIQKAALETLGAEYRPPARFGIGDPKLSGTQWLFMRFPEFQKLRKQLGLSEMFP